MRKVFKIILSIFVALIIIVVAFGAIILFDVAAYTATGSQTLTPTGTSVGKAIVIYDPGLSGTSKTVATQIATDLQTQNYQVTLAGIKSSAAADVAGYKIIIVGGPVYAGALTSSVKDTLLSLDRSHGQGTKIGVFGSGQGATSQDDINQLKRSMPTGSDNTLSEAVVVKIGSSEDLNTRAQDFANQLVT
jgi:flavorubredoxin